MRPVIYQLFVRHFSNHTIGGKPWGSRETNGCGTFAGVNDAALDALARMGVTHVWFTGVLRHATQTAHPGLPADPACVVKGIAGSPYAVTDYFDVDPDLAEDPGNRLREYADLLERCRRHGMVPLMDFIPNHVSRCYRSTVKPDSSFGEGDNTGVFFSRDNAFFYLHPQNSDRELQLPQGGFEPEHGHGRVTGNNAETWTPGECDWYETVKLNYGREYLSEGSRVDHFDPIPSTWDKMTDILLFWASKGVDGFRMDVISLISKHQEFEDGPAEHNGYASFNYNANGPRVHEFLREMRSRVLSKYDTITVGECSGVNIEEAKSYASEDGSELSMVFQFDHASVDNEPNTKWTDRKIDLVEFKKILSDWQTSLAGIAWNSLYLGNHDQPRQVSRYGNDSDEYRELSAKMLATSIHMMQGTPYVYQGEELGMTNYPFTSIDEMRDIEAINAFKELQEINYASKEDIFRYIAYKGRDNARTPMQWNDSLNGGFTTGTPWIAVNPNYKTINAEEQIHRPDSVFNYYKKLIRLRHENKIIVYGDYELLLPESKEIFAYKRIYKDERLIVFCNYSDKTIVLPAEFENLDKCEVLISNYDSEAFEGNSLRPYEAIVLVI